MNPAIRKDELARIVIGVDPAVTSEPGSDSTGIIVAGLGTNGHGYILKDLTCKATPDAWARTVVKAYQLYEADRVICEVNQGGDLVTSVLKAVDPNIPVKKVHASRGKITRADPISALYEQGLIHHCGEFPLLEDQLCSWFPGMKSPDRLDALVYSLWELFPENLVLGLIDMYKSGRADKIAALPVAKPGVIPKVAGPAAAVSDEPHCPKCNFTPVQELPMSARRCVQCGHQWFDGKPPQFQLPLGGRRIKLEA